MVLILLFSLAVTCSFGPAAFCREQKRRSCCRCNNEIIAGFICCAGTSSPNAHTLCAATVSTGSDSLAAGDQHVTLTRSKQIYIFTNDPRYRQPLSLHWCHAKVLKSNASLEHTSTGTQNNKDPEHVGGLLQSG